MKKLVFLLLFLSTFVMGQNIEELWKQADKPGINKFGFNGVVGTTREDVWDGGSTYSFLDSAVVLYIESDSTSDDSSSQGQGAWTVQIQGLDSLWGMQVETVVMNGDTAVATSKKWIRVFRMKVQTGGNNASGTISLYDSLGSRTVAQMGAGNNQTLMAIYTVPAGMTAKMNNYYCSVLKANTTGAVDFRLWVRPNADDGNTVFNLKHAITGQAAGSSYLKQEFRPPFYISEKSDIKLTAEGSTSGFSVSGGFDLELNGN